MITSKYRRCEEPCCEDPICRRFVEVRDKYTDKQRLQALCIMESDETCCFKILDDSWLMWNCNNCKASGQILAYLSKDSKCDFCNTTLTITDK